MIDSKEYERIAERCRTLQPEQVKQHIRTILGSVKIEGRDDWATVDSVIGAVTLLNYKAEEANKSLLILCSARSLDAKLAEEIYQASTYRLATSLILLAHAQFLIDRTTYRDDNADWYFDRIFNAIEESLTRTNAQREKAIEVMLAKIRSVD